ncbi:synaptic vesicle 2-related protein-like [Amphiura filiformis]|uniref:synaptic vesicle 2-related protein-like n=1 Tax=Amphiura filiformis TaxID=82378 RepID=UPI003B212770
MIYIPGADDAVVVGRTEQEARDVTSVKFHQERNGHMITMVTPDDKMIGMTEINSGSSDDKFTVEQAIDQIGFGRFQVRISLITAALSMTDAGELMLLSILSPELQCKWHLAKWQQALITTIVTGVDFKKR